jgi:nitroreductase
MSEASAQYALYNMILYAQARGIGSRINAGGPITLDRSRAARRRLGLERQEHILATLELGYPAVRFRNKVEGKTMPMAWNGQKIDG